MLRLCVSEQFLGGQFRGERAAYHEIQISTQRERLQILQKGELQL